MMREQLEGMELSWPSATTMHTPLADNNVYRHPATSLLPAWYTYKYHWKQNPDNCTP